MRSFLLSLLLLLVAAPAAAHAATIRIEQQGPSGEPITGGCYEAHNDDYSVTRCDDDDLDEPGVVLLPNVGTGTYEVEELHAPPGYYATTPFTASVTNADEVDRHARRHQARPLLRVVTTDANGQPMTGSCWLVQVAGDTEGGQDECDADDGTEDGVTRYLDLQDGDYKLVHLSAPTGIDRIDDTTFTMPAAEDKTLTFALAPAVAPANTVAPSVAGGHRAGDELTGSLGTWTGSAEIDYNDSWERCELDGTGCQDVGDYEDTYTVTADDAGKALRYRVLAGNDGGRVQAWSPLHAISSLDTPEPTTAPSITGSTSLGQTLTANVGEWTNAPTFSYQWQRCAAECADIANATGATYRTAGADAGQRIRLVVTAHNSAGERSATTAQTEPINDAPYVIERPSTTGTPAAHNDMEAYPGHWATHYGSLSFTYVWFRCDLDGKSHCVSVGDGDIYNVRQEDEGSTLLVEVTATDAGGTATARSNPRTVLTQRPLPTARPSVTGLARFNEKLTAHLGTWSPKPRSFEFYWERCKDGDVDQCEKVDGSDGDRTYKVDEDDWHYALRIVVWAIGSEGRSSAVSDTSATVFPIPPTNLRLPSISGTARVGQKLKGDVGEWSKPLEGGFTTWWYRCPPGAVETWICDLIEGTENDRSYKVQRADFGRTIRFLVGAIHDGIATVKASASTEVVPTIPPVNTVDPSITGLQRLGEKLTANRGTWIADGKIEYTHWWTRCNADGEQCQTIDGSENDRTYTVSRDDLGHTLKLRVHASTEEGDAEAWSTETSRIEEQPPVALSDPSIAGTARVDQKLTANLGAWTSAQNVHFNPQWYRCEANGTGCVPIDDADGRTYRVRYSDVDHRIKLLVTAVSDEGTGTASSAATDVIAR
jgi:hypothetical protein